MTMFRCTASFHSDGEDYLGEVDRFTRVDEAHPILVSHPHHFVRDTSGPDGTERDASGSDGSEVRMTGPDGSVISGTDRYQRDRLAAAVRRAKRSIDAGRRASSSPTTRAEPKPAWWLPQPTPAPRRPRAGRERLEEVEFNPRAEPSITIELSRSAQEMIIKQIQTGHPDLEVGGGLYSPQTYGKLITITDATDPGPEAKQGRSSMRPDWDHYENHEAWLKRQFESKARLCGLWHSHPGLPRRTSHWPSRHDLSVFARMGDQLHGDRFIAIIATPEISQNARFEPVISWSRPKFSAWITWRDRSGLAHCEPANVMEV